MNIIRTKLNVLVVIHWCLVVLLIGENKNS